MDPNRRTTSLPKGMLVRILSTVSRGGNVYGIDAEEVSKHTGIALDDHKALSDWASVNDALFYAERPGRFSLDEAADQAAAMGVPRVVLFRMEVKNSPPPPPVGLPEVVIKKTKVPRKKKDGK